MYGSYVRVKTSSYLPRLPLQGQIDITYRCNNNCRHCWVRIPQQDYSQTREMFFSEIRRIVDQTSQFGCRRWLFSGGEPLFRPDFPEIFDYITARTTEYLLVTNGTLITPAIAQLLTRKGTNLVSLYGATAEIHDHITQNPGSFQQTMQGLAYLKEAGAACTIQIIPLKDNYSQLNDMIRLAESLSGKWRIGATWLQLSAYGDTQVNTQIRAQRLSSKESLELEGPYFLDEKIDASCRKAHHHEEGYLFFCFLRRQGFHIDPYGRAAPCQLIKDPSLRCDLRTQSFGYFWDEFIPHASVRYQKNEAGPHTCGECAAQGHCRQCPAQVYLEHRHYGAHVESLCEIAQEARGVRKQWQESHCRYFRVAGIQVRVESELPFSRKVFQPKFAPFAIDESDLNIDADTMHLKNYFGFPSLERLKKGSLVYHRPPWAVYRLRHAWVYVSLLPDGTQDPEGAIAVCNQHHSRVVLYHSPRKKELFLKGGFASLAFIPSDQIFLTHFLAEKQGVYFHACGVNFHGQGLLFLGRSEAGKSTMARMWETRAEVLCDERIIVRRHEEGFRIHGTWSHGDYRQVSSGSAPLEAIFFLEKSSENRVIEITDRKQLTKILLETLIRPLVTQAWWEKTLWFIEKMIETIPCYRVCFDTSGKIIDIIEGRYANAKEILA